jgi:hypothetical protein
MCVRVNAAQGTLEENFQNAANPKCVAEIVKKMVGGHQVVATTASAICD